MKKIIAMVLVFATSSLFAMSLSALNSASKAELMEINGIGEVKAAAIIKERKHGKFKSYDDLTRVDGVGAQIADNVKNGVKSASDVKKVSKKTTHKKAKTSKKETEEKAKKTKSKKSSKEKAEKSTKKRKIKSMDDKKKELKTKAKKTKTKKTKAKKEKKTKSKKKN